MSDNEEYPDINYGIDDAYSDSFKKRNESDDGKNTIFIYKKTFKKFFYLISLF